MARYNFALLNTHRTKPLRSPHVVLTSLHLSHFSQLCAVRVAATAARGLPSSYRCWCCHPLRVAAAATTIEAAMIPLSSSGVVSSRARLC